MIAHLRGLWEGDGRGALWLSLGIGSTFLFGLALQLLGLRSLSDGDYAIFVLGLGVGNIANALAVTIQPVVAAATARGEHVRLPVRVTTLFGASALITLGGAGALGGSIDPILAMFVLLQIPLHAAVALGLGRLQGLKRFSTMAWALTLWASARLLVVGTFSLLGAESVVAFVIALPAALGIELALLWRVNALEDLRPSEWRFDPQLLRVYLGWALVAWLLNADAVYGHLLLEAHQADAYATALTLGRQSLYAAAPLVTVLLPVTIRATAGSQRGRLLAIGVVTALLLGASYAVIGWRPEAIVRLLTDGSMNVSPALVRGYVLVGAMAAGVTLVATFCFALGQMPSVRWLSALTLLAGGAAALIPEGPTQLLVLQGATIAALLIGLTVVAAVAATGQDLASTRGTCPPGAQAAEMR